MKATARGLSLLIFIATLAASCKPKTETAIASATFANAPVIVISIDTLRADHLPAYGYEGVRTPNIDSLRNDGVLFRNAYAQVPLTFPSHTSMLTGLLPADHGVRDNIGYRFGSKVSTLPQTLKQHGYATGAAISSYVLRGGTGLGSIFDSYDDHIQVSASAYLSAVQRRGDATVAAAQKFIAQHSSSPFFFLLHLFEPHAPYEAPEAFRSAAATPYDGEIAYVDSILGSFLDDLRSSGLYDRAIIVLMSDHGEGLGDHGEGQHGIFVYREAIHVPLIVKLPKSESAGALIDDPVALVDIFPTVLSLTGIRAPQGLAGVALLGPDAKPSPQRRIFSESLYARLHLGWSDLRSLIDGSQHYIDAPRAELYVLEKDPREQSNVLTEQRRAAASFREDLGRFDRNLAAPSAASPEEAAKLAALGYISSASTDMTGELPDPKDKIQEYGAYTAADEQLRGGDARAAAAAFERILSQNPKFTDAAIGLARSYETLQKYSEAAEVYRRVLERSPVFNEQVALALATAYLNAGKLREAREHAQLVVTFNAPAAHMVLARAALKGGSPRDAQQHAREAAAKGKNTQYEAQAVLFLSEAILAEGPARAAEALRVLDEFKSARAARGELPARDLEVARASALMRMSRANEAMDALRTEIRTHPDNVEAYGRLAAIHLLQRDPAGAEAVFTELVRANPSPANFAMAAKTFEHFGQPGAAQMWRVRGAQAGAAR